MSDTTDFVVLPPLSHASPLPLTAEEMISGLRAVCVSQSGNLRVAMASVSGRMPAVGIVTDNVLSGDRPNAVYTQGFIQPFSGMCDFSGYLGKGIYVGRSGQLVQWNASFNSGGFSLLAGADFVQRLGVIVNSGGFLLNVAAYMTQAKLLPLTELVDSANLGLNL